MFKIPPVSPLGDNSEWMTKGFIYGMIGMMVSFGIMMLAAAPFFMAPTSFLWL
ncbi:hypothetical protein JNK62_00820 [bacterium]|nr:hypothetical protein [bacterium]